MCCAGSPLPPPNPVLTMDGMRGTCKRGRGSPCVREAEAHPDLIGGLHSESSELWASEMGHAVDSCAHTEDISGPQTKRGGQCTGFKPLELVLKGTGVRSALRPGQGRRETAASALPTSGAWDVSDTDPHSQRIHIPTHNFSSDLCFPDL